MVGENPWVATALTYLLGLYAFFALTFSPPPSLLSLHAEESLACARVNCKKAGCTRPTSPQERISVEQALTAYTAANARAGFQEDRLGRIAAGYLADFVVLSQDLFGIPPERIVDTRVERTVIGGVERWSAPAATR